MRLDNHLRFNLQDPMPRQLCQTLLTYCTATVVRRSRLSSQRSRAHPELRNVLNGPKTQDTKRNLQEEDTEARSVCTVSQCFYMATKLVIIKYVAIMTTIFINIKVVVILCHL